MVDFVANSGNEPNKWKLIAHSLYRVSIQFRLLSASFANDKNLYSILRSFVRIFLCFNMFRSGPFVCSSLFRPGHPGHTQIYFVSHFSFQNELKRFPIFYIDLSAGWNFIIP